MSRHKGRRPRQYSSIKVICNKILELVGEYHSPGGLVCYEKPAISHRKHSHCMLDGGISQIAIVALGVDE